MKKRIFGMIGIIVIASILFSGCSLFNNAGKTTEDTAHQEEDKITAEADIPETEEKTSDETDEDTTTVQDLLDDIDSLELDKDDEKLPEWLREAAYQLDINVSVINMCGADIGLVSTLDPYTEEQIDIGDLPADQMISLDMTWPKEKTTFDLAIYNLNGDLVSVTEVDITGITESVTIKLSGNGDLSSITSEVK